MAVSSEAGKAQVAEFFFPSALDLPVAVLHSTVFTAKSIIQVATQTTFESKSPDGLHYLEIRTESSGPFVMIVLRSGCVSRSL